MIWAPKAKQENTWPSQATSPKCKRYHKKQPKEVVGEKYSNKYEPKDVLQEHKTFAIKANFYERDKEGTIMCLPKSMHALQKKKECMKVFTLTGFNQFFQMPPCDMDAKRCHELLTTLQEDGACMLSNFEGEPIEVNLTQDIVVKSLRLQEGNHVISSMKLTLGDRMLAFTADNANDSVYALLNNTEI